MLLPRYASRGEVLRLLPKCENTPYGHSIGSIPPFRSRVSGVWEPPFRWGRASAPDGESRYLFRNFRYVCALSPHELSIAAGGVVHGRHAGYLLSLTYL